MKKLAAVFTLALVTGLATLAVASESKTISGNLIDVACGTKHRGEAGFADGHDKDCLLMDKCVASGYAVLTEEGKFLKFDTESNRKVLQFIKDTEKDTGWKVSVTGTIDGDMMSVTEISLQK
ncbi:MAG TPA: hypothetical protein VGK32_22950 [Vicinamibacterales bacterium]|jgi:hypothetical protein